VALVQRSEVTGVYVVDDQQQIRMRQVRVGGVFGDRTEVLSGLHAGERVAENPLKAGIYLKSRSVKNDE
jgi:multidrug efflux pump subunit AcrA (membrane-fusion protein)